MKSDKKKLRVVELFAGVGGFRLGLEGWKGKSSTSRYSKKMSHSAFKVVWSNQWEPSTTIQHASQVYEARFGKDNHSSEDIAKVVMFLLSEDSSYVHGENILVDGGVMNSVLANIGRD